MKRSYINEVKSTSKNVLLQAWVQRIRLFGNLAFIILRDSTGLIQCVARKKDLPYFIDIKKLTPESVIEIQGTVKRNKEAKKGYEVIVKKYKILSKAIDVLPIQVQETDKKIKTDLSKRLDERCLDLRKQKNQAIFKIQKTIINGMQEFFLKNNFTQIFTPSLMGVPSESGAEAFEVKYFKKKTFLRQDPQLHRQLTIAGGFERIFEIGPSWRAEKSHTTKHICEHRTCAAEIAFIKDETDTMKLEQDMVVYIIKKVIKECKPELKLLNIKLKIPKTPFPELRFPKIYEIVRKMGGKVKEGEDLSAENEKLLWNYVKKKYKAEFYFINRFPFKIKPFYVMKVDNDPKHARSVDLFFKGTEMSSGGQREHREINLLKNAKEKGLNPQKLEWFIKHFHYGVPPHGGFSIGIERLTQVLLNLDNIREATLFPRDTERILP